MIDIQGNVQSFEAAVHRRGLERTGNLNLVKLSGAEFRSSVRPVVTQITAQKSLCSAVAQSEPTARTDSKLQPIGPISLAGD